VPHGTIEQKLVELFQLDQSEAYVAIVMGVPDAVKGETLVLLATRDFTVAEVRERLLGDGVMALWVPRVIHRVDKIPVLGTGKLDLKECKRLAVEAVA
jgi:acyl-[acyl-carrier-protein]-phospholipid O-acyltransferase/long-chain-fatty-acid--[acyl-carrier-protein] ligase